MHTSQERMHLLGPRLYTLQGRALWATDMNYMDESDDRSTRLNHQVRAHRSSWPLVHVAVILCYDAVPYGPWSV